MPLVLPSRYQKHPPAPARTSTNASGKSLTCRSPPTRAPPMRFQLINVRLGRGATGIVIGPAFACFEDGVIVRVAALVRSPDSFQPNTNGQLIGVAFENLSFGPRT